MRAKLIEVAAVLDRVDRAAASDERADQPLAADPRREAIEQAISILLRDTVASGERAEAVQRLFSRDYDPQWRQQLRV